MVDRGSVIYSEDPTPVEVHCGSNYVPRKTECTECVPYVQLPVGAVAP